MSRGEQEDVVKRKEKKEKTITAATIKTLLLLHNRHQNKKLQGVRRAAVRGGMEHYPRLPARPPAAAAAL